MKLAIVILGKQNSGKTATLKEITRIHAGKSPKQMKAGWRILSLFPGFNALTLHAYFVPASPTETNLELNNRFEKNNPEVLFMAEQVIGKHYESTIKFLKEKDYQIKIFELTNNVSEGIFDRFNSENKTQKLQDRAKIIMDEVRAWVQVSFFSGDEKI